MQFIDLKSQQKKIRKKIMSRLNQVLNHGQYIMGSEISELESQLAGFVGSRHAIGVSSGTDALLLALMCYDIGQGDAIITTPFTFISTVEVICLLGATPVFVDIHPDTYNIDSLAIEKTIKDCKKESYKIRGIIPVDLFGLSADYDTINDVARNYELFVIEDAAQSFGATYKEHRTCSLADIACTSFFPAKPLGAYGDGGMCFTNDDAHAEKMRSLMLHGQGSHRYEHIHIGINGRLDTMQAAILLEKFAIFPDELIARQQVADRYTDSFKNQPSIVTPNIPSHCQSSWAQYSIQVQSSEQRHHLQSYLKDNDIPSAIYYPIPIHQQPAFKSQNQKTFPVSESISQRIMSLPMHPYLTPDQQEIITTTVLKGMDNF